MKLFSKIENSKDITDKGYVDEFYKKPTSGIPKSDLASAVQTSLSKADAAVPNTRKVNNKALSSDITLSASDVGALPDTTVIPTKVSDLTNDSGFTTNTGTVTSVSVKMNGATKGTVTSSGTIDLGTVLTSHQDISDKANLTGGNTFTGTQVLNSPGSGGYSINAAGYIKGSWLQASATSNKGANTGKVCVFDDNGWVYYRTPKEVIIDAECAVKYEVKKTIDFGNSGALYIGKFNVYDTNVTCEITSTTGVTYSGKLVIATQNYVIMEATVYGDAANTVAPNFFIKPSSTSDPYIEVYFKPTSWSKNVVHIYGSAIAAEPTDVCTNVSSVPSTATLKPTNALNSKANLNANNVFTGTNNKFKGITTGANDTGTVGFEVVQGEEAGGDVLFAVDERGIQMDPDGLNNVPLIVNSSMGTAGQVLTSNGTGKTPGWTTPTKGTVTQVKVNGSTYNPNSAGLVDLGSVGGIINSPRNFSGGDTYELLSATQNAIYSFVGEMETANNTVNLSIGDHTIQFQGNSVGYVHIYIYAMQSMYSNNSTYVRYLYVKSNDAGIDETYVTNYPNGSALELSFDLASSYNFTGREIIIGG